jgi:hypothetical protein
VELKDCVVPSGAVPLYLPLPILRLELHSLPAVPPLALGTFGEYIFVQLSFEESIHFHPITSRFAFLLQHCCRLNLTFEASTPL